MFEDLSTQSICTAGYKVPHQKNLSEGKQHQPPRVLVHLHWGGTLIWGKIFVL